MATILKNDEMDFLTILKKLNLGQSFSCKNDSREKVGNDDIKKGTQR